MKKDILVVIFILILTISALAVDFPDKFNAGLSFIEQFFGLDLKIPNIPFLLGLDLQGGTHLVYEADLSEVPTKNTAELMAGLRDVIERRVNYFGVQEPLVQVQEAQGKWRLIVELAGVKDVNQAIKMIGQTPRLEFREPRDPEETQKILDKKKEIEEKKPSSPEELQQIENWDLALQDPYFKPTKLGGQYLKGAKVEFNQTTFLPYVALTFNDQGAKLFEKITERNVGKQLAIYIDGQLISAPVVQEKISGGRAQITGDFTVQEAKALARNLNAGALPVPINLISQQTVGPSLGKVALKKSLWAGLIGFVAVVIFMIIFYRLLGLIAVAALGVYLALLLMVFKLVPVTLTLAGIGGVILSIGMAVDANILIFSRTREELAEGKSINIALIEGFRRAWPSIRDGNLTTLLVALILFYFGTGFVRGFALTLSVGIILSMISAIIVTRYFLEVLQKTKLGSIKWFWK